MAGERREMMLPPAMTRLGALLCLAVAGAAAAPPVGGTPPPEFQRSRWFGEWVREELTPEGIRCLLNLPARLDPKRPTRLVVYATPNGNSVEETLGSARSEALSWRYDIHRVAAQTRRWRELNLRENVVLACVEAEGTSWPGRRDTRRPAEQLPGAARPGAILDPREPGE
jgi:hypothetical protein